MIGNDIVDLAEAKLKSNWQRPRFLEKLFTLYEQQLIQNSENSFVMVWRLWSMKEAAYKLYTQGNPSRFYNPKQFECEIKNSKGKVRYQDFKCYVQTRITSSYIISEARIKEKKMNLKAISFNGNSTQTQSEILRFNLLNFISTQYNIKKEQLSFSKDEFGIPTVIHNAKHINISLTHHGKYGFFSIL